MVQLQSGQTVHWDKSRLFFKIQALTIATGTLLWIPTQLPILPAVFPLAFSPLPLWHMLWRTRLWLGILWAHV